MSCVHDGGFGDGCAKCVEELTRWVPPMAPPVGTPFSGSLPASQAASGSHTPADPFDGKSLEEIIAFCRNNGIRKLSYRGVEIEFAASSAPAAATEPEALQKFAEAMAGAVPSDTEMLGWSAPEFPSDLSQLAEMLGLAPAEKKE